MRLRQLLIVHPSHMAFATIKRHLLSELNDISFTNAESGRDALECIKSFKFSHTLFEISENYPILTKIRFNQQKTD